MKKQSAVSLLHWSMLGVALLATPVVTSLRAQTVLRTQVYHQLTAYTNDGPSAGLHALAISADGSKIAFTRPYYGPTRSNLIYSVNFDGSGLTLIDQWAPYSDARVDISGDGTKVISWQNGILRMANGDGSNPHQVLQVTTDADFRLSPKGDKVFFATGDPFDTVPPTYIYPGGLYAMNLDGGGLTNLIGTNKLAQYFGLPLDKIGLRAYYNNTWLAVSGDGSRLLHQSYASGYRLMRVNVDGTGLMEYPLGTVPDIYAFQVTSFGLSGDGNRLFYVCHRPGTPEEIGVINWDGSGRTVLMTNSDCCWNSGWPKQMNHDGSKLLFPEQAWLINTDGTGRRQWVAPSGDTHVLYWGNHMATMSSNANRFAYLPKIPDGGPLQLATMEVNPTNYGSAPLLSQVSCTPAWVRTTNQSSVLLSARVSPTNNIYHDSVIVEAFRNGLSDGSFGSVYPNDAGLYGDLQARDGVYANNWMTASWDSQLGPRTLRFKTESVDGNSFYHATMVEVGPLFVVSQAPSGPPPAITGITPPNAPPGTQVTITGTGFDPIATNNVVLFGNVPAQVISVNPAGTQLVVVVPLEAGVGSISVTVGSLGQTSSATTYTLPGGETIWVEVMMLAGVNLHGNVGKTYRVDYLSDLKNTNSWVPLATNVLPTNPWFWPDVSSTNQPRRFYRIEQLP